MRRLSLLVFSTALSLLGLEVALRLLTDFPISWESHRVVDPVLGHRMDPERPEIDHDGFRNQELTGEIQIAVLGDSHTYGYNVSAADSWPGQLARLTGRIVYNYGVGAYGILHYRALLDAMADKQPAQVLIGLYLTNDLAEVCHAIQMIEYWRRWAQAAALPIHHCSEAGGESERSARHWGPHWGLREKTALGSAVHRLLLLPVEARLALHRGHDARAIVVRLARQDTLIAYDRIAHHERTMDRSRPNIALGYKVGLDFLREAAEKTAAYGGKLGVLFVPSKETVYYDQLVAEGRALPDSYHRLVTWERALVHETSLHLDQLGVAWVDALPSVRAALTGAQRVYPLWDDGHPLAPGYRAYAEAASVLTGDS